MQKVKKEGVITVEEAKGTETTVDVVEGMQFDRGYISPYFVTDTEKMECQMENPYVLIYDKKISLKLQILDEFSFVLSSSLHTCLESYYFDLNHMWSLKVYVQDLTMAMLEDIAVLTGGIVISEEKGMKLEGATMDMLGTAEKIVVNKDNTTIVNGAGDKQAIQDRIGQIKMQMENII